MSSSLPCLASRHHFHCCVSLTVVVVIVTSWQWPLVSHRRRLCRANEDMLPSSWRCRRVSMALAICFLSSLCWCGRVDVPSSLSSCHRGTGRLCHVVVVAVVAVSYASHCHCLCLTNDIIVRSRSRSLLLKLVGVGVGVVVVVKVVAIVVVVVVQGSRGCRHPGRCGGHPRYTCAYAVKSWYKRVRMWMWVQVRVSACEQVYAYLVLLSPWSSHSWYRCMCKWDAVCLCAWVSVCRYEYIPGRPVCPLQHVWCACVVLHCIRGKTRARVWVQVAGVRTRTCTRAHPYPCSCITICSSRLGPKSHSVVLFVVYERPYCAEVRSCQKSQKR